MVTTAHRYQLDGSQRERKYKTNCPYCGRKKTFTRYKDYQTGEYVSNEVGMCDAANKCGAHVKPKEYFERHPDKRQESATLEVLQVKEQKPLVPLSPELLKPTLKDYDKNSFITALFRWFTPQQIETAISDYYTGTLSAGWKAEEGLGLPAVFWFIDIGNNIRAAQVKLFDKECHTAKYITPEGEKRNYQTWIHSILQKRYRSLSRPVPQWLEEYAAGEKVTCLFGEHLLNKYPSKPVALTEAPKSAFIASMAYPQYVWVASTSLTYLTKERCQVLRGRRVFLFPDTGIPNPKTGKTCYDLWKERVEDIKGLGNFHVESILEEHTTPEEKEAGMDLADWIIRQRSCTKSAVNIAVDDIIDIPSQFHTAGDFGGLILATIELKDGRRYDILYDKEGELITEHEKIKPLAAHFNKSFIPGKLCGIECLLHIINN